jgi:nitrile hydratase accessory protein
MRLDGTDGVAPVDPLTARSERAFCEPWQARAFAIAILASRQGCFTWPEWTRTLSLGLRGASDAEYFDHWLEALQSLLIAKGAVTRGELSERRRTWEEAYRHTPHGAAVRPRGQ